jgi:uncharacterized protein
MVANSFLARFRGLMGIARLGDGAGLLLPGTNSIHMLFMRFPIDCLFLAAPGADGAQRVVDVRHSLPPWRGVVWWARGARDTVELPAGTLKTHALKVGDTVRVEESPE